MGTGWAINLAVAEWIIRRTTRPARNGVKGGQVDYPEYLLTSAHIGIIDMNISGRSGHG